MSTNQDVSHTAGKSALAHAINSIVSSYRRRKAQRELTALFPIELSMIANDLGVTEKQLLTLASQDNKSAGLMARMLSALNISERDVSAQPILARDMHVTCSLCTAKRRCGHELQGNIAAGSFRSFCPNAANIDWLMQGRAAADASQS
jgi:hypothetical protein